MNIHSSTHHLVMEGLKNRINEENDLHVVGTFTDPREGIQELNHVKPNVFVIDFSMPHMDGFEVAKLCKEKFGLAMKIIMLSGYSYRSSTKKRTILESMLMLKLIAQEKSN